MCCIFCSNLCLKMTFLGGSVVFCSNVSWDDFPRWQHFIWRIFIDPPVDTKKSLDHIMTEGEKHPLSLFLPLLHQLACLHFCYLMLSLKLHSLSRIEVTKITFFCMTIIFLLQCCERLKPGRTSSIWSVLRGMIFPCKTKYRR